MVIETPRRTSRSGACEVVHEPDRTTTPSSRAVTATYSDSAANARILSHCNVALSSDDAITVSVELAYAISSTRQWPDTSIETPMSEIFVRRLQRPDANAPKAVSKVARPPFESVSPASVITPC